MNKNSKPRKDSKLREALEKILESKGGQVAGITLVSYLLGLTAGAVGKQIGGDVKYVLPLILPGLDLMGGRMTPYIIPYAFGVATNYIKEIYCFLNQNNLSG